MKPGERIKQFRESKGLKQGEFAESLGYSQGFVSEIECGKAKLSRHFLEQLMQVYAISADYILSTQPEVENGSLPEQKEVTVSIRYYPDLDLLDKNLYPNFTKCPVILVPISARALKPRVGHSYIMVVAQHDGMNPVISPGDIIVVDLDDKEIREKRVYLIKYENEFLFRYVTRYRSKAMSGFFLNAQEPSVGTHFVEEGTGGDILFGRVVWVCKLLS